jgi:predicted GNAT family N-acyltransferase
MELAWAVTDEQKQAAYGLRYEIYHNELKWNLAGIDHEKKIVTDEIDENANILIATDNGKIVATVRAYLAIYANPDFLKKVGLSKFYPLGYENIALNDKLIVHKDYRNSLLTGTLLTMLYTEARNRSLKVGYLDCKPHLLSMYQQVGYRQYSENFEDEYKGFLIPLVMLLDDHEYLLEIQSPLYRIAKRYTYSEETREFYFKHFPSYERLRPLSTLPEEMLWAYLTHGLLRNAGNLLSFFEGLNAEEVIEIIKQMTLIESQPNETLLNFGEESNGMYCVIKGEIEVLASPRHGGQLLSILGAGETFGEIGFLTRIARTATLRTRTQSRILVITEKNFAKFEKNNPALAIKLLRNLFAILAERFNKKSLSYLELKTEMLGVIHKNAHVA